MDNDEFSDFESWKTSSKPARRPDDVEVEKVDIKLEDSTSEIKFEDSRSTSTVFDDDLVEAGFVSLTPARTPPFGLSQQTVYAARWRALAAVIVFVVLTVLFVVLGTRTFWASRMRYQTWVTLFTIIVMLSALILDLWDVSLTFFVANTVLLLAKVITIQDALAGFSNEGILSTAIMFVIARAIEKTKVLEWVVRVVLRRPRSLRSALLRILPASSFWSFWTNNTPIVAVLIPVMETWSIRANLQVSHLLMPMSFAVILGGLVTIIGTSTNLVVQGLAAPLNLGFFDVGAIAAPYAVLGVTYLILTGHLLLPAVSSSKSYVPQMFAWHRIPPNSSLVGLSLLQTKLIRTPGVELLWVKPHDERTALFVPDCKGELNLSDSHLPVIARPLQAGDQLCFIGIRECLEDIAGLEICFFEGSQLEGMTFFEMRLKPNFPVSAMSVKEFNQQFQCRVRRINRDGEFLHLGSGSVRDGRATVLAGDICLVEARFDVLHLQTDVRFSRVAELPHTVGKVQSSLPLISVLHPFIAVLVLLMIVVLNAAAIFSIYEAAAIGIMVLLVTDVLSWKDVYTAIPGNLMLMICYSFALSAAMTKSGLGQLIGEGFAIAFSAGTYVQLFGIFLCTSIITAIAPNSAAATIVYPIVVAMSRQGSFSLLAGIYCMMVSASADFCTPFGYSTNLMCQKPGGYKFLDYTKLGVPLTLIGLVLCPAIAMFVWPKLPCVSSALVNCTNTTV